MLPFPNIFLYSSDESRSSSSSYTASTSFINPFGTSSTTSTRITNTTDQSTTTISDYSLQSSDTQGSTDGIFEEHPGLNPDSERIVELQSEIHEQLGELLINEDPQKVLVTPNSPLEQFAILPLIPMDIGNLYFSFTNPSLFMLLTLSLVRLLVHFVTKNGGGNSVPNAWQSLVELLYDFVLNPVNRSEEHV